MNKLEKLEHNMVKISMEVEPQTFEDAVNRAYLKQRGRIQIPGFRKGKAPRKMIERFYGPEVFYNDALDDILPDLYVKALDELKVDAVSRPEIDMDTIVPGEPVVLYATVAVKPEVELGEYKGLVAEKTTVAVTEDDVMDELKKEADRNSRLVDITDRAAEMGDTTQIDFDGYVDGVPFEGGKGENYTLVLGSHSFVDTFEDQIVGKNIGDEFDVHVTFPENYHAELANKQATFKVKLNRIQVKELPELDDDYAKDYTEFDTIEEYKADLQQKLLDNRQKQADEERQNTIVEQAVANAQIDVPEAMINDRVENMIQNMTNQMQYQGITLEQYMQYTGTNMVTLRSQARPQAEKGIRRDLVLEAIAKAENIEVSDEEFEAEVKRMADMYKMDAAELAKNISDSEKEAMKAELKDNKAIKFLVENAKEA